MDDDDVGLKSNIGGSSDLQNVLIQNCKTTQKKPIENTYLISILIIVRIFNIQKRL